ncbi:GGDEF domain-containing protein [Vreelandella sp. TE19]
MLDVVMKCWSPGVAGNSTRLRRQIELCNQLCLFCIVATLPYQLFYMLYDVAFYRPILLMSTLFVVICLVIMFLNHRRRYNAARNTLVAVLAVYLLLKTSFLGADSGVPLYYFALAGVLIFLFPHFTWQTYGVMMGGCGALYVIAHFVFASRSFTPIPAPWTDIMYGVSVTCVLVMLGVLLYLFRHQIEQAEDELTLTNQALLTLSSTDPLTGLANRRVMHETLKREWRRLTRKPNALSIIMCDVDHFKQFNDHYGHNAGDDCLRRIARVLEGAVSRSSDLVARFGGEEFVFILPGINEKHARHLGEKLCKAVRALDIPNAGTASGWVTISLGIASLDPANCPIQRTNTGEGLLNMADKALYRAKDNGRNRVEFLPYPRTDTR